LSNIRETFREVVIRAKDLFREKKIAYLRVFKPDEGSVHSDSVVVVLKDLAKFCRANKTCFNPDPRVHANLEGRREVWLRILEHLNLTPDEYWDKYGRE